MADDKSLHTKDASDRKLDQEATMAHDGGQTSETGHSNKPSHDPAKIAKHDDDGKDRLFEGRQQHDDAEKNSEKTRLARDVQKHHHDVDPQVADNGNVHGAKRKN